jgi:hypothetical protein
MNNNGDSFVGNRKTSSATGEEITYDAPIPTITGEDPSRLSVVFDEVTIKERLVVEGGNSGTILSQFDGPVTFNKEVKFNGPVSIKSQKISDTTDSTSPTTGALVVPGGVGIGKNLNIGGFFGLFNGGFSAPSFTTRSAGTKIFLNGSIGASSADYAIGTDTNTLWNSVPTTSQQFKWYGGTTLAATLSGIGSFSATILASTVATGTAPLTVTSTTVVPNLNVSQLNGLTAATSGTSNIVARDGSGNFSAGIITATFNGAASSANALNTANNYQVNSVGVGTAPSGTTGEIRATNDITAFYSSDQKLKENINPIPNALEKLSQISGNTFDWKSGFSEIHSHSGTDVGVIAQEIEKVLPQVVTTRENGYKAVQYEKIIALLIEAVKELKEEVNELKRINN